MPSSSAASFTFCPQRAGPKLSEPEILIAQLWGYSLGPSRPSSNSLYQEKVSSVFYTTVMPMLNPLIYNLRNKNVKQALTKVLVGR
jgi:hypothetical protein